MGSFFSLCRPSFHWKFCFHALPPKLFPFPSLVSLYRWSSTLPLKLFLPCLFLMNMQGFCPCYSDFPSPLLHVYPVRNCRQILRLKWALEISKHGRDRGSWFQSKLICQWWGPFMNFVGLFFMSLLFFHHLFAHALLMFAFTSEDFNLLLHLVPFCGSVLCLLLIILDIINGYKLREK